MNRVLQRIGALTVGADLLPSWGSVMSQWNPSDRGSRRFEHRHAKLQARPRRTKPRKVKKLGVSKSKILRRTPNFHKDFDSTFGCPGEGPRRPTDRRIGRSRIRPVVKVYKRRVEGIAGKRTSVERRISRFAINLREGILAPQTRKLYAQAFVRLWAWARRPPPDRIVCTAVYDRFLSGFIE